MATKLFSSEAAQDYYFQVGITWSGPVKGVMSADILETDLFDLNNYRDDFFNTASAGNLLQKITTSDGNLLTKTTEQGALTDTAISTGVVSAPDSVTHIAPRAEQKKRSLIRFWSDVFSVDTGTGNLLASYWADELVGWSTVQPRYI